MQKYKINTDNIYRLFYLLFKTNHLQKKFALTARFLLRKSSSLLTFVPFSTFEIMKNIYLTCAIICLWALPAFAQSNLKDVVAVVRPNLHPSSVKFLLELSEEFKKDGYPVSAERFKSYAEKGGGQGSGFVYQAADSSFYLITNRHVVLQAESVTVEFESANGDVATYKNCTIVAIDNDVDLALIAFPAGAKLTKSISLSRAQVHDGDEVFSAGFPDLAGSASWQLGKGIVSNAALRLDARIDPLRATVIQHTAQVDPGSSGGPLLLRNGSRYEVVGLNTWKVINRENVNIAIPSKMISEFVSKSLHINDLINKETLEKEAKKLVDAATDYKKMAPYISYGYLSTITAPAFRSLYSSSSSEANRDISYLLDNGRPVEALRIAVADGVVRKLDRSKNPMDFMGVEGEISAAAPTAVRYTLDKKPFGTTWVFEQGTWRIASIDNVTMEGKAVATNGVGVGYDVGWAFRGGLAFPLVDKHEKMSYSLNLSSLYTYVFYDFDVQFGQAKVVQVEPNYVTPSLSDTTTSWKSYVGVAAGIGLQLPIKISDVYLVPYAKGLVGVDFGGEEHTGFTWGYSVGVQAMYNFGKSVYPLLGVEYRGKWAYMDEEKIKTPALGVYIGIAF